MPRISDAHLNSVAILMDGDFALATGFLVQLREEIDDGFVSSYLVTCKHCLEDEPPNEARFRDGSSLRFHPSEWTMSPTGADIAVLDVTEKLLSPGSLEFLRYGEFVESPSQSFGIGSDVYMLGLFADDDCLEPRARFGNISSMGRMSGKGEASNVHLGDMRSRTGFSGAPVFAYELRPVFGDLEQRVALLGVHSGQYHDELKIELDPPSGELVPALVPSSMTIIEPAWELQFIVSDLSFASKRAERRNRTR